MSLTLGEIVIFFKEQIFRHFVTIKPPRDQDVSAGLEGFFKYLKKRKIRYWIVKCISECGFIHYHGIVSYPNDEPIENMIKNKLAFQRKVNRDLGFNLPLVMVNSIERVYMYIHSSRNKIISEYIG